MGSDAALGKPTPTRYSVGAPFIGARPGRYSVPMGAMMIILY
jgi:hypothetical protein